MKFSKWLDERIAKPAMLGFLMRICTLKIVAYRLVLL